MSWEYQGSCSQVESHGPTDYSNVLPAKQTNHKFYWYTTNAALIYQSHEKSSGSSKPQNKYKRWVTNNPKFQRTLSLLLTNTISQSTIVEFSQQANKPANEAKYKNIPSTLLLSFLKSTSQQPLTFIKKMNLTNIIQNKSIQHLTLNSHQLKLERDDQHDGIFQVLT